MRLICLRAVEHGRECCCLNFTAHSHCVQFYSAFWSNGPNWPAGGEIDIVEGVNDYTVNQATIHTASGCTLPNGATSSSLNIAANIVGGTNCAAAETNNAGCGEQSSDNTTYGAGFNSIGGGVYSSKFLIYCSVYF